MRRRFSARLLQHHILAHRQAELALQGGFNGGQANLAIALRAMPVTAGEIRAGDMHGKIQRCPRNKLLIVDITTKAAWNDRGAAPPILRRRDTHDAEKRPEWNIHTKGQSPDHSLGIEGNIQNAPFGKFIRQCTAQGADQVEAPILAQLDVQDIHLQHIARFGTFHGNRACQDMRCAGKAVIFLMHRE